MSAINAFVTRDAVYMMTDGLSYVDGVPYEVDCRKAHRVGSNLAIVSCTGPSDLGREIAEALSDQFDTFDKMIKQGADLIKSTFERHAAKYRNGDAVSLLVIIGWHESANRPALYSMGMSTDGPKLAWCRKHDRKRCPIPTFRLTS